jgi:hypothetical protein
MPHALSGIKSLHVTYYGWHDLPQGLWIINEYFNVVLNLSVSRQSKTHPWQKLYKRIPFGCHTCPLPPLWHEFHNCLCNFLQSKVSYCLHMYFLWRHHLPPDNSDWLIDLHIVLTYDCWHCFLIFNIWVSHALEMTINFYYPTPEFFCFLFTKPFTHSKFCLPNPFLFGATPHHK